MEKQKILIVDDKEANIIALEDILEDLDIEIITASSGNEAIQKAFKLDFDLILMDVQMPGMDGYETVEYIRKEEKNSNIPIIFQSAIFDDEFNRIKGVRSGGVSFVSKPISDDILIGKVNLFLKMQKETKLLQEKTKQLIKKNKELKEALANVEQLSGLLPICSSCKKIRDDKGYWGEVEEYIIKHSEATFTHGICPACIKKLYPDLYKEKYGTSSKNETFIDDKPENDDFW